MKPHGAAATPNRPSKLARSKLIASADFLIFREGRRAAEAGALISAVQRELRQIPARPQPEQVLSLLLRAGELECALSDTSSIDARHASSLTDLFAKAAIAHDAGELPVQVDHGLYLLEKIAARGCLTVSTPEGFAYYALHPLDYGDMLSRNPLGSPCALVIGIRSIGTSLSAVVAAKLRQTGIPAERITVRPTGHPYDRRCDFDEEQRKLIGGALISGATFVVCDEGPGRSGSSFLSVAEALEREGVPRNRLVLLCSHQPDVQALCAPHAAIRWSRYRSLASGMTKRLPSRLGECLGGGEWRRFCFADTEQWPALWPQMERLRYLARDGRALFTFEGHGPYGTSVRERNRALSDEGWGVEYFGQSQGFGCHAVESRPISATPETTPPRLKHMAEYCAWRSRHFSVNNTGTAGLQEMTRVNFEREFGMPLYEPPLPVERPAVCDSAMQRHAWVQAGDDRWLKRDAALHGDDHFFPGPCDIAWDLAGIAVEWELDAAGREFLLHEYRRASGDDATLRLRSYELAYAVFRLAWCKMAAASVDNGLEQQRLMHAYRRYRRATEAMSRWLAPAYLL